MNNKSESITKSRQQNSQPSKIKKTINPGLETLPSRVQSGKPRCKDHHATATDIGTCPYSHIRIRKKWKPAKVKEFFEIISLVPIKQGDKVLSAGSTIDVLYTNTSFFKEFEMKDYSFGDEIFDFKSHPRLASVLNEKKAAIKYKKTVPVFHIKKAQKCECGCEVSVMDEHRGEIVCPKCGIVQQQVQMKDKDVVMW
ncbi:MAG: hypothetical protein K8E24_003120 [Methanobacterium paludis]|nr:hypothetical protein [Methanobacterium paludis]